MNDVLNDVRHFHKDKARNQEHDTKKYSRQYASKVFNYNSLYHLYRAFSSFLIQRLLGYGIPCTRLIIDVQ